jgi:hypothetical protein
MDQPGDGLGHLANLRVSVNRTTPDGLCYAMREMILKYPKGDRLKSARNCGHLS